MRRQPPRSRAAPSPPVLGKIAGRLVTGCVFDLARGPGWRVTDMHCWMGPRDVARENVFPAFRVAAVVAGSFAIRSTLGDGVAVAGSLLLGNACDCYCCRHDSTVGDRCINFDFEPEFLEGVREALGVARVGERFRQALVPPAASSAAIVAVAEAVAEGDTRSLHEAAFEIAAAALAATQDARSRPAPRPSVADERRIIHATRYVQARYHEACTLEELAAVAGLSRYHFLRQFRRVVGQTPHRYVLATRLRHAARRLRVTSERILDVATASGFGDLSNFNAAFARAFAATPSEYRNATQRSA